MIDTYFFYAFALMSLAGAVLTITRRSAVHSAVWLIVSLLGVAGLYLLQQAEFLFAVQIILYIGGITVLFLFVIMLVNLDQAAKERQFNRQWLLGAVVTVLVTVQVVLLLRAGGDAFRLPPEAPMPAGDGNVEQLADILFSEYLLPFEVASLLLLAAIVGSVLMAKRRT
jgi:NADH-quinone oxidoreductase subunit J